MTETERELGLQLGDAHAEIRMLKEERDNALKASRWESDLCQQALDDLKPYQADAEKYRWMRNMHGFKGCPEAMDTDIDKARKETP